MDTPAQKRGSSMANTALYNRWRGQSFEDILGQDHITHTLRNQIRAGRIGHAYLFTGLRGTGKTSTARILAKAVNCVGETDDPPCNACPICTSISEGSSLDLIEIDAASNRGIDEIRDLRERVAFAPSEARFKVYVIDEVHMLTNEAFNALLKTLEEPPAHVIFVMCTTEPHRLPDTIISRCQRFDFRRAAVQVVAKKLKRICEQEAISIAPQALEYVARKGAGSFRDAESLLDQLAAYGSELITQDLVQQVLGAVDATSLATIIEGVVQGEMASGLREIDEALDRGADPRQFLGDILDGLRAVMLLKVGADRQMLHLGPEAMAEMRRIADLPVVSLPRIVQAIKRFNQAGQAMRYSTRPQIPFELAYVESALPADETQTAAPAGKIRRATSVGPQAGGRATRAVPRAASTAPAETGAEPERAVATPPPASGSQVEASGRVEEIIPQSTASIATDAERDPSGGMTLEWARGNWSTLLLKLKIKGSHQVRALLNSAYPQSVSGDLVTLVCEAKFHADTLMSDDRRSEIEKIYSEVLGKPVRVACVADAGHLRQLLRTAQAAPEPKELFDAAPRANRQPNGPEEDERQALVEHPAVQELLRKGGEVSRVVLNRDGDEGESDGKQGT